MVPNIAVNVKGMLGALVQKNNANVENVFNSFMKRATHK